MDVPPEVKDSLPGIGGAFIAAWFFRRGWAMGIAMMVCGAIAAHYLGGFVGEASNTGTEVGGFLTGLFSMAIFTKLFDMIAAFDAKKAAADLWESALKRIRGN